MITPKDIFKDTQHLDAGIWNKVNRNLLAKSIAELMREDVIKPVIVSQQKKGHTLFRLETDNENIYYTFSAYLRFLNYWHIDKESIHKNEDGNELSTLDVPNFFIELQNTIGINSFTLAHYVEELLHTLYADAFIQNNNRLSAAELADSDFQTIEHSLDGHPWVIVNKGRIGFDTEDYVNFTPESGHNTHLLWVAAHKDRATLHLGADKNQDAFYESELGKEKIASFRKLLTHAEVNPEDYIFIPVHLWQWQQKLVMQFAHDITAKYIIPLGLSDDLYSPQQSIRTFFNLSQPNRHYVKTSMSILNTSHIRGLCPKQLSVAPRLTDWIKNAVKSDPYLQEMEVVLLGEVVSVSYAHSSYSKIKDAPYQYNEFLGAMWRENPVNSLKEGENLMTMAALLHVDNQGKSLVQELIEKSGLSTEEWLKTYFRAYLKPVMQLYYQHSLCIDPHGQNVILILKDYVPTRIALQDFVGDILINEEAKKKLPQEFIDKLFNASPNPENAPLVILIAVFDAFFRYLSDVMTTAANYPEVSFWNCVHDIIIEYQEEHPELKEMLDKYDLFIPEFKRLIFNSRRLFNGYEETSGFPHMKKSGFIPNPLHQLVTEDLATIKEN
ncbi:IucA/IucC family siderophore biosynthesis protein [Flavobacterium sp. F-65]|uniref:IucA/IucC family siderophore biosynthesis protein n=1 Tax=Flavobacterium pisciphilum TaxID=2893755 RepID=A0ABS8MPR5_9FLAO|nr:IucA/IucC family siderophore biosynthesis protein [Flavobacterium sp. F-65]MCC9070196.1 IucA/IucC family siderophore biosynthesis protein [Flavobacterium sp. F-65]